MIQWADNDQLTGDGPDVLKFIFTRDNTGSLTSESLDGLELGRFRADPDGLQGYFGIGDWLTFGSNAQPNERLDLLDQTIRLRNFMDPLPSYLSTSYENTALENVLVVDPADGRVYWRTLTGWGGGGSTCDWFSDANNDVWTALSSGSVCPQASNNVGIGIMNNSTTGPDRGVKLYVYESTPSGANDDEGIRVLVRPGTVNAAGVKALVETPVSTTTEVAAFYGDANNGVDINFGGRMYAHTEGETRQNRGVAGFAIAEAGAQVTDNVGGYGFAQTSAIAYSQRNVGVEGLAQAADTVTAPSNIGVMGKGFMNSYTPYVETGNYGGYFHAQGAQERNVGVLGRANGGDAAMYNIGGVFYGNQCPNIDIGVYAKASGSTIGQNWAFWSEGESFMSGSGLWTTSDAMFKQNVQALPSALESILQLSPKTYTMDTATYGYMGLASEQQAGLIADSVQLVIPELVREVTRPAEYDTLGNVVHPEITFKAMNYTGLVPYLVGAVKDQNAQIEQLQAQLAAMQAQINACCASTPGDGTQMFGVPGSGSSGIEGHDGLRNTADQLRIQPNPFSTATRISYSLDAPGQVRLIVSSSSGKQLRVLEDAQHEKGTFTYECNTTDLASGVYNVMLLVDGAPMVQKAVKIER